MLSHASFRLQWPNRHTNCCCYKTMRIYFICSCFYPWHDSWLLNTSHEKNTYSLLHQRGWGQLQDLITLWKWLTSGNANRRRCKAHIWEDTESNKWHPSCRADLKKSLSNWMIYSIFLMAQEKYNDIILCLYLNFLVIFVLPHTLRANYKWATG